VIDGQDATLALMLEYLAIPAWNARPVALEAWADRLTELAGPVVATRESSNAAWLEVASLRLRGYVLLQNGKVSAINFELHDADPDPALKAIEAAARALGFEIHADEADDDDEDEDDEEEEDD
jgi:hypothetical protein